MPARVPARKPSSKPAAKQAPPPPEREDGMISGNLTFDPELRFTASGAAVARLRVAVQERYQDDDGRWQDGETEFYDVSVWRQQAENVTEGLRRGDRIVAIGYWQDRTFTNKDDEEVTVREFTAREIGPSMLFREVRVNRPAQRSNSKPKSDPWESDDEPPF